MAHSKWDGQVLTCKFEEWHGGVLILEGRQQWTRFCWQGLWVIWWWGCWDLLRGPEWKGGRDMLLTMLVFILSALRSSCCGWPLLVDLFLWLWLSLPDCFVAAIDSWRAHCSITPHLGREVVCITFALRSIVKHRQHSDWGQTCVNQIACECFKDAEP